MSLPLSRNMLSILRSSTTPVHARFLSTTSLRLQASATPLIGTERIPIAEQTYAQATAPPAPSPVVTSVPPVGTVGSIPARRPVGGLRGGLLGFLLGFSLASAYASYYLLQEYKLATSLLQGSVEELRESTGKMSNHLARIHSVEKDLKALSGNGAIKEDVVRLRAEMKKVYDGLHVEVLDLRAHVWGVEQDLHKSAGQTKLRI